MLQLDRHRMEILFSCDNLWSRCLISEEQRTYRLLFDFLLRIFILILLLLVPLRFDYQHAGSLVHILWGWVSCKHFALPVILLSPDRFHIGKCFSVIDQARVKLIFLSRLNTINTAWYLLFHVVTFCKLSMDLNSLTSLIVITMMTKRAMTIISYRLLEKGQVLLLLLLLLVFALAAFDDCRRHRFISLHCKSNFTILSTSRDIIIYLFLLIVVLIICSFEIWSAALSIF